MSLSEFFSDIETGNFNHAIKRAEDYFTDVEKIVLAYLTPLADQIVTAGANLGKTTIAEGVQVLIDASRGAVAAGAARACLGKSSRSRTVPWARMTARSMEFSSSRTLPGHG